MTLLSNGTSGAGGSIIMTAVYVLFFVGVLVFIFMRNRKREQSKKITLCPNCGQTNFGKVRFCKYCGAEMEPNNAAVMGIKKCPNCGFKTEANASFCPKCGKPF